MSASTPLALTWMGWWPTLVDALAAYRVARLITRDKLCEGLRARLDDRYGTGLVSMLWTCTGCLGFWCAVAAVYLHTMLAALAGHTGHLVWMLIALPWAMAAVIALISDRDPT